MDSTLQDHAAQVWMVEHCISYKTLSIGKMWSLILKTMWTHCEDFFKPVVIARPRCFLTIMGMASQSDDFTSVLFPEGATTKAILAGLLSVAQVVVNNHTHFSYPAHTLSVTQKEVDSLKEYAKEVLTLGLLRHSHWYHNITTFSHHNCPNCWYGQIFGCFLTPQGKKDTTQHCRKLAHGTTQ